MDGVLEQILRELQEIKQLLAANRNPYGKTRKVKI